MNKARREDIDRAVALIEEAKEILEAAAADEREYYDNMPEGLQSGEKGMAAEEAADALDEAGDQLDGAIASCATAQE